MDPSYSSASRGHATHVTSLRDVCLQSVIHCLLHSSEDPNIFYDDLYLRSHTRNTTHSFTHDDFHFVPNELGYLTPSVQNSKLAKMRGLVRFINECINDSFIPFRIPGWISAEASHSLFCLCQDDEELRLLDE